MKRITIVKRTCWNKSKGGGYTTEEIQVLQDMTDKKLVMKLQEMNKPYRSNLWEIVHDFKFNRKKDRIDYLKYCIDCYGDQYNKDYSSAIVGEKIAGVIFVE